MRPPTEADAGAAPSPPSEATPGEQSPSSMTEDKEVAEWVHKQLNLRKDGRLHDVEKPALHAVALDKVATSPIHDDPATSSKED